jgi:hypothetical protein
MYREVFKYCDFTAKVKGFEKWRRFLARDIPSLTATYHNVDIFCTVQKFRLSLKELNEDHYCGLFFDFDSDDLDKSKADALRVADFFQNLGIPDRAVTIYFSGNRGFHYMIEPEIFGIKPSSTLTQVIKTCCSAVADSCRLVTFDRTVYSSARMWRIPNSLNTKVETRSYKIQLTAEELKALSGQEIRELARTPRTLPQLDPTEILPEFSEWWSRYIDAFTEVQTLSSLRPKNAPKFNDMPKCVEDIITTGLKLAGTRNRAVVILATFCKAAGMKEDKARELLTKWVTQIPESMTSTKEFERVTNVRAVVGTVYRDEESEKYVFACSYIRALGNSTHPVKCLRNDCKYNSAGETLEPRVVRLEESTKACYEGVPLVSEALVAGKDYSPYLVPAFVKFECRPPDLQRKDSPCNACNLGRTGHKYELRISANNPAILGMIGVSTDIVHSILYSLARIRKNCRNFSMSIIDKQNVIDIMLVPQIKFTPESIGTERSYSLVQAYFVGHDVNTNSAYDVNASLQAHPKQQYAVLLVNEMKSRALAWQEKIPDDIYSKLTIFQTDGDPLDKFDEIWTDLEANVSRLWGRKLFGFAVDVIYHSVLSFYFDGKDDFVKRGWAELLVYGDTDTGKTVMSNAITTHYQLGSQVSCETTTRTGLTYSVQDTIAGRWIVICGVLPLNDRGLVWLDEFRSLPDDDRKELTQMRVDGVIRVARARQAILPCRVRLIFVSGPRRSMTQYDYGIESIWEVFGEREDIRRLDMVMIMGTNDVNRTAFFSRTTKFVDHKFTTELCNALIRWAWSLKPEQIKFEKDAISSVYEAVRDLSDVFTEDIPVLKIEDLRYKIARIAVAIAARTFNTKDQGKTLTVEKRHVISATTLLKSLYSTKVCGLLERSTSEKRRAQLEDVNKDEAKKRLNAMMDIAERRTFRDVMLEQKRFGLADLRDMMGWSDTKARDVMKELVRLRLVRRLRDYKGYAKTEPFVIILRGEEKEEKMKDTEQGTTEMPFDSSGESEQQDDLLPD